MESPAFPTTLFQCCIYLLSSSLQRTFSLASKLDSIFDTCMILSVSFRSYPCPHVPLFSICFCPHRYFLVLSFSFTFSHFFQRKLTASSFFLVYWILRNHSLYLVQYDSKTHMITKYKDFRNGLGWGQLFQKCQLMLSAIFSIALKSGQVIARDRELTMQ